MMTDTSEKKSCFIIAPIGKENSPERKNTTRLKKNIIDPALVKCGYAPGEIAHEIDEPGFITDQVIERLRDSDLVIADLTGHNPNVFYELAIRHVLQKPFIHVISKGLPIPFDTSGIRTIEYDFDFESVPRLVEQLAKQIESADKNPDKINNPITVALDISNMGQSDGSAERLAAAYMPLVSVIIKKLDEIERRLPPSTPYGLLSLGMGRPPESETTISRALKGGLPGLAGGLANFTPTDVSGKSATGENPTEKEK